MFNCYTINNGCNNVTRYNCTSWGDASNKTEIVGDSARTWVTTRQHATDYALRTYPPYNGKCMTLLTYLTMGMKTRRRMEHMN